MPTIAERFKKSWNVFFGRDPTREEYLLPQTDFGIGTSFRPDRVIYNRNNAKTIVSSIYNRIALDVAAITFKHVKVDKNDNYQSDVDSFLNDCLNFEANIDQTGRELIQDIVYSLCDEGVVAVVPVDADMNSTRTQINGAEIYSLRVGKIVSWYPAAVKVRLYNEIDGQQREIMVAKSACAIIENPLYAVMNEPNSTVQRLVRTLNRVDAYNDSNVSSKLDLIIQLPYVIKSELRKKEAEKRRQEIEDQLMNSKYGVAYADGTERIVQLNRSLENNLWQQATDLMTQLYNQLGITQTVFDGTADEQTMINYYNRSIEPYCAAIAKKFEVKFLTLTARTQGNRIRYFRDPFKLVPTSQIADLGDKFTRNEIMSSNELRAKIGLKPDENPRSDMLMNKNINQQMEGMEPSPMTEEGEIPEEQMNADVGEPPSLNIEDLRSQLNSLWKGDQNE